MALVLGGIILAMAGMGFVKITEGLVFTKKNAATTLKAQVVLTRIEKELHIATSISPSSSTSSLTFTNKKEEGVGTYTLCLSGSYMVLAAGSSCAADDSLIDNVENLTFTYLMADGTPAASPDVAPVIDMSFTLSGAAGTTSSFTMRVVSRNL